MALASLSLRKVDTPHDRPSELSRSANFRHFKNTRLPGLHQDCTKGARERFAQIVVVLRPPKGTPELQTCLAQQQLVAADRE
jgi:hypothetical protein